MKKKNDENVLATNRQARHNYEIEDTIEAGIELQGTEIKSVRAGKINLRDGYVSIKNGQANLSNVHISEYKQGNIYNHDPLRVRRLLLHKKELKRLAKEVDQDGMTIVPLKVYLKHGFAKVLIGVAKGKKNYDKRESLKQKELKRELQRNFKLNQF
ncbi:SsrA-binding protein SmpB [Xylocopilactobacillus apicola]|uniref:SsrA-binding protein n=1 Tax=Xylocopilactobacillus apicola TaxID=2932184 RepID=A0AAU9DFU0_9LACO|nr:SsrA-binding protein SmpB [Xylocopilactobacillus apicola]BDR58815.1 SsrA-binding protein [Xylocopilactobacillus apicola]